VTENSTLSTSVMWLIADLADGVQGPIRRGSQRLRAGK
jgi:hypothetical protein